MQYLHTQTQPDARLPAVGKMLHQLLEQYGSRAIEINWIKQGRLLAACKLDEPWLLLHPDATVEDIASGQARVGTGHDRAALARLQTVVCDHALWAYAYADSDAQERRLSAKANLKTVKHQRYRFSRLPNIKIQDLGEPSLTLLTWLCSLEPLQAVSLDEMQRVSQLSQEALNGLLYALLISGCMKKVPDGSFQVDASAQPVGWTDSVLQWLRQPSSQY